MNLNKLYLLFFFLSFSLKSFAPKNMTIAPEKDRTIMIYLAAYNDLSPFADRNISQFLSVGSTPFANIVIYLDIRKANQPKVSKIYYVEKSNLRLLAEFPNISSGDSNTLLNFCRSTIKAFPAKKYDLILWNHGTGAIEPNIKKAINSAALFKFNNETKMIELDRSIEFLEYIYTMENYSGERGSCFDDGAGTYIKNQQLGNVLDTICQEDLKGEPFEFIIFDACLMAMIDVLSPLKKANNGKGAAQYFIGSQEVVLGSGYDYSKLLIPLTNRILSTEEFAQHIVTSYAKTYQHLTRDYTQSAINLQKIDVLEKNIDTIAKILIEGLKKQKNKSVKKTIAYASSKNMCTRFDEPSYKDLSHLLSNLKHNISKMELIENDDTIQFRNNLNKAIEEGLNTISNLVLINVVGSNLKNAKGISIYFPENRIHPSYPSTVFAQSNRWSSLIAHYLAS